MTARRFINKAFLFQEHKKWLGVHEFEAKAKYTQKCRGLKTYGITFFLVKVNTQKIRDKSIECF
jgi:hypothetical protein